MSRQDLIKEARALAHELIDKYEDLYDELTEEEMHEMLVQMSSAIKIDQVLTEEHPDDLADEAAHRQISCLPWVSNDDLLAEVDRRGLSAVTSGMSKREFEEEARARGYRRNLAEFPKSEIKNYLKIQGLS